jgi:hypothetical protein
MVFSRLKQATTTEVYETYWKFAAKRQDIFIARFEGKQPPWTDDQILNEYKFTNAYRASDRVSQYLIKHVIYDGDQSPTELFFRTMFFKLFNRIGTWELLKSKFGEINVKDFSVKHFSKALTNAMMRGRRIYSAAYIMPSGGKSSQYSRKHEMHLAILDKMLKDDLPIQIAESKSMDHAFNLLKGYRSIGDFLAYQFITDINYSSLTNFSEMEFVVPGPGARDGIRKCFSDLGGLTEAEIIKVIAERQDIEFQRLGLNFKSLWGRPLQLIDCQNLFCEVDKYARYKHPHIQGHTGRTRIKQKYHINLEPIEYWYPPKWGINNSIIKKRR